MLQVMASMLLAAGWAAAAEPDFRFATYLGGREYDESLAVAVGPGGEVWITGETFSTDFPVVNAIQSQCRLGLRQSCHDAFVAKLSPDGRLLYSTYLGTTGNDSGRAIAVDAAGNAYVAGIWNDSTAFVAKFDTHGQREYFIELGGPPLTMARAIAVDRQGNAVVAGQTSSPTFPRVNALQPTLGPNSCEAIGGGSFPIEAFVTKLGPAGNIVYSTYLEGSGNDIAHAIGVDDDGAAYVAGATTSPDFPAKNALQGYRGGEPLPVGSCEGGDAFLAKLDPAGSSLAYSTFLGGSRHDVARALAVHGGAVILAGTTQSADFPLQQAYQAQPGGGFVAKVTARGAALAYSSYLPGPAYAAAVEPAGNAWLGGASILQLNPTGGELLLGATLGTLQLGLAAYPGGGVVISGGARDGEVSPRNAAQAAFAGVRDAFVARLFASPAAEAVVSVSAASFRGPEAAPGSLVSVFGPALGPGIEIRVEGRASAILFAGEGQANVVLPDALGAGPAQLSVARGGATIATGRLEIDTVAPGLFSANRDGHGPAAALTMRPGTGIAPAFQCAARCTAVPIEFGAEGDVFLLLFGTGIRGRTSLAAVSVTIGGVPVEALYAGPQGQYAGLDQINVRLPRSLAGRGEVDVAVSVDGRPANRVTVRFQ